MAYERESMFSPALGTLICTMMAEGLSLREVCRQLGNKPSVGSFLRWVAIGRQPDAQPEYKILAEQYACAQGARAAHLFDEMIEISDNAGGGERVKTKKMIGPNGTDSGVAEVTTIRGDVVDRDKLKIDTRKWILARMDPKKYGDKMDLTSSDGSLAPAPAQIIIEGVQPNAHPDTE